MEVWFFTNQILMGLPFSPIGKAMLFRCMTPFPCGYAAFLAPKESGIAARRFKALDGKA